MASLSTPSHWTRPDFTSNTHRTSCPYISPLSLDLSGRKVLVTGAASGDGVGFATAIAFARAGVSAIALLDVISIAPLLEQRLKAAAVAAKHPEPLVLCGIVDISDLESVQQFQRRVSAAFDDKLDVLVNNAAHQEPYLSILDIPPETYWRTWEVNVRGLFNMARTFMPMLLLSQSREARLATMLNVTSSGALSVRAGSSAYRTSKLAVLRLTEALDQEHKSFGLLTFSVNPGAIKTNMTVNEPEHIRQRLPHTPELAGDTIVWLVSNRRDWLAGRYISCPWDMEELTNRKEEIVENNKLKMRMIY